jgi:hypothetical protein
MKLLKFVCGEENVDLLRSNILNIFQLSSDILIATPIGKALFNITKDVCLMYNDISEVNSINKQIYMADASPSPEPTGNINSASPSPTGNQNRGSPIPTGNQNPGSSSVPTGSQNPGSSLVDSLPRKGSIRNPGITTERILNSTYEQSTDAASLHNLRASILAKTEHRANLPASYRNVNVFHNIENFNHNYTEEEKKFILYQAEKLAEFNPNYIRNEVEFERFSPIWYDFEFTSYQRNRHSKVLYLNLGGVDVRPGDLIVTHSGTLG